MRVTKAQAEQNRAHIVATAARLFRERGYDGVGVAELMAAAGFTHGGFYKHFRSKADLMAEASASGLSQIAARAEGLDPAEFVESYVSREHRDGRGDGCTIAALSGDAARQPADIKAEFTAGIENLLTALQAPSDTPSDADQRAARTMAIDSDGYRSGGTWSAAQGRRARAAADRRRRGVARRGRRSRPRVRRTARHGRSDVEHDLARQRGGVKAPGREPAGYSPRPGHRRGPPPRVSRRGLAGRARRPSLPGSGDRGIWTGGRRPTAIASRARLVTNDGLLCPVSPPRSGSVQQLPEPGRPDDR